MSDKKKRRAKNETPSNKLSKEDDAIARFVRFNCPTSSTVFEGNEVHYFSAKKAIDLLVDSKKYGSTASDAKFPNNASAEEYLRGLLERGLFFRAKKVVLKKKDKTKLDDKSKKKDRDLTNKSPKSPKPKGKEVLTSPDAQKIVNDTEAVEDEIIENVKKGTEQEEERKKKKKVKLLFHDVQSFGLDPADVYVWVFDPTPFYKKVIGLLIVLGTIAGCLFPLWPDWLRLVIYYLSITGIALFGLLLGVALARTALFGIIWAVTLGRHKLWILPNLTEDCGFLDSFKPFYTHEYVSGGALGNNKATADSTDDSKKKKKKNDKNSTEEGVEKIQNNTCEEESSLLQSTDAFHDVKKNTQFIREKSNEETTDKKLSSSESEDLDDNDIYEGSSVEGSASEKSNEEKLDQTDENSTVIRKRKTISKDNKSDLPYDDFVIIDSGTPSQ